MRKKSKTKNFLSFLFSYKLSKTQLVILGALIFLSLLFFAQIIYQAKEDFNQEEIRFVEVSEQEIAIPSQEQEQKKDTDTPEIQETEQEKPKVSLGGLVSSTFSDSFSGMGWVDPQYTNLVFDFRGKVLSFPLKIELKPISAPLELRQDFHVIQTWTDGEKIYLLTQNRQDNSKKQFVFQPDADNPWQMQEVVQETTSLDRNLFSSYTTEVKKQEQGKWLFFVYKNGEKILEKQSDYQGVLNIGQCKDNIFIVFSSYFSQAYEITPEGEIKDLTSKFGWRVTENGEKIYSGFPCYIKNKDGSLIRWDGEIPLEISKYFKISFNPDFFEIVKLKETNYLVLGVPEGGTKIYLFADNGFDLSKQRQVVSKRVSTKGAEDIRAAVLEKAQFGGPAQFEFFLSNNGGETWKRAQLGEIIYFEEQGKDLRWAVRISPEEEFSLTGPWIGKVFLKYWYKKQPPSGLPSGS